MPAQLNQEMKSPLREVHTVGSMRKRALISRKGEVLLDEPH